jgi:hypothetical protein
VLPNEGSLVISFALLVIVVEVSLAGRPNLPRHTDSATAASTGQISMEDASASSSVALDVPNIIRTDVNGQRCEGSVGDTHEPYPSFFLLIYHWTSVSIAQFFGRIP